MTTSLTLRLQGTTIGTVTNLSGDYTLLSFAEAYLADLRRPILSQAFVGPGGEPLRVIPRTHRVAPPFLANLLPESGGLLRGIIARRFALNETRDFPFLAALGGDLPGAVELTPDEPPDVGTPNDATAEATRLRFSLAGVQLKFSASFLRDRLSLPLDGIGGSWIAKLPTNAYPELPANEFAVMSLARAIGLDVPQIAMIPLATIDGLPDDLPLLRKDEPADAYTIARFDRGDDGAKIHVEDFNQIANQKPEEKYDRRTSSWIANVVATLCEPREVDAFVRRLIFGVCVGNNDMHLKNWAVRYPDGRHATLAPMYDFVCTRRYFPTGELALTIGGERRFERIDATALAAFAEAASISKRRTVALARETTTAIRDVWPTFRASVDDAMREALEQHFAHVPLMQGR